MAKIKVKVYACKYCEKISTNPLDFLDIAVEEGPIKDFDGWVAEEYDPFSLFEVAMEFASEGKSAADMVAHLRDSYKEQMAAELIKLFENSRQDDWYYDEVELDVSLIGTGALRALICTETETHMVQG